MKKYNYFELELNFFDCITRLFYKKNSDKKVIVVVKNKISFNIKKHNHLNIQNLK